MSRGRPRGLPLRQARIPSEEELRWITRRAVLEIIPEEEFVAALRSGRRLRLKMGFDPSRPDLHLGHAVGLRKLRQLQELGHQVVVIVGDWTAQIGDPSGQSQTRPMLSAEEVRANAETYLRQFFRIVDRQRTEVRLQSEWFDGFTLADVIRLAARFTVAQVLRREDFAARYGEHKPIGVHELLYPLLQAYDSVAVQADVEFGGSDQRFNLLVGRELQEMLGQPPQACFIMPLLVGTDGAQKMSKSLENYIALEDPPGEMYGKVMSIPDALIMDYFELVTDVADAELAEMRQALEARSINPMELKMRLAREIVAQFYDAQAAGQAEEEFASLFRHRKVPEEIETFAVSFNKGRSKVTQIPPPLGAPPIDSETLQKLQEKGPPHMLGTLLADLGVVPSASEGRRLMQQGAIEIDGSPVTSVVINLRDGMVIRVGKRRFLRIVDADRQGDSSSPP